MSGEKINLWKKNQVVKFGKGDWCYIHAKSPILAPFFNRFGQPISPELLDAACFEGICDKEPRDFTGFSKNMKLDRKRWGIKIDALSKAESIFVVDYNLMCNDYFVVDINEPGDWLLQSKLSMDNLYKLHAAAMVIKEKKLAASRGSSIETVVEEVSTLKMQSSVVSDEQHSVASIQIRPRSVETVLTIDVRQDDLDNCDNITTESFENEKFLDDQFANRGLDLHDDDFGYKSLEDIDQVNTPSKEWDKSKEEDVWFGLNSELHKCYGYGEMPSEKPSDSHMAATREFHMNCSESFKPLAMLWLRRFASYLNKEMSDSREIENDDTQLIFSPLSQTESGKNLRPRGPNLRTNFFIQGQNLSLAPLVASSSKDVQDSSNHDQDFSIFPENVINIPELINVQSEATGEIIFNTLKVGYNELEQFFKTADKRTKFENLYDVVVIQAVHSMFVHHPR